MVAPRRARFVAWPVHLQPTARIAGENPNQPSGQSSETTGKSRNSYADSLSKAPVRYSYTLTQKGKELQHVLDVVVRWSKKHIAGVQTFTDLNL